MQMKESGNKTSADFIDYLLRVNKGRQIDGYEVRDFRTMQMLDWFIKEQGEEEKNAADLITKMELFGGDSKGLYMLNSELKARVYSAPSLVL